MNRFPLQGIELHSIGRTASSINRATTTVLHLIVFLITMQYTNPILVPLYKSVDCYCVKISNCVCF